MNRIVSQVPSVPIPAPWELEAASKAFGIDRKVTLDSPLQLKAGELEELRITESEAV
jgi:hypothetical protein